MQIQNEEATRIIREGAKLALAEGFPQVLLPNVVPVMDMSPDFHRKVSSVFSGSATSSGGATIYTARPGVRFVITGFSYGFSKDATCDTATGSMTTTAIIGGVGRSLSRVPVITLKEERGFINMNFPAPLVCDENTSISISSSTYTVGLMVRTLTVYGYELNS